MDSLVVRDEVLESIKIVSMRDLLNELRRGVVRGGMSHVPLAYNTHPIQSIHKAH